MNYSIPEHPVIICHDVLSYNSVQNTDTRMDD